MCPPQSLICSALYSSCSTVGIHDGKLDLPSLGIKYCAQSKMKLALSGLLNPREGVISLFCSSICASYRCHTSNYKLTELKIQKKRGCTSFSVSFCRCKNLTVLVIPNHHLIFNLLVSPYRLSIDPGLLIYMYMTCILLKPDSTKCGTSTDN